MDYQHFTVQLSASAAIRLVRSRYAPMILSFLYGAFKKDHVAFIPESRLQSLLERHLDELREHEPEAFAQSAHDYLEDWCSTSQGFLRKYRPEKADEAVFELTADTEKVFQWLESLKPQAFVGTESKLKRIFALLADILENATRAPDVRIRKLREEQRKIEEQIQHIKQTGVVETYTPTQINERFSEVLDTSRQLLGDFRAVEENFREITRHIIVRRAQAGITKGAIVGHTLDAQAQLRGSDQGQSFYSFWEFLLAPGNREQLQELVQLTYNLPELRSDLRQDIMLRRLQPRLIGEGEKVVQSNQQLAAQLRRILDAQQTQERQALLDLIQEIKQKALDIRNTPPDDGLIDIEIELELFSTMDRPTWSPDRTGDFQHEVDVWSDLDSTEALQALLSLKGIDIEGLRENVRECLLTRVQITLAEILAIFPPKNGVLDILAYLVIADTDRSHIVMDTTQLIGIDFNGKLREFRVPEVVFS